MRFNQLTVYNDGEHVTMTSSKVIEQYLAVSPHHWLIKCEMDDVVLEIKDNIVYWKSGILYWGNTQWMVVENCDFRSGVWNGGIWLGGKFKGKWMNGVWKAGEFDGEWIAGDRPEEKI